ncbi:MAG: sterol desaturase family protein [Acidimicrobiia bacterium]
MDLTVTATPLYFGTMALEYRALRDRARREGPSAADYERRDTIASLSMGVGSLLTPLVLPRILAPFAPGKGKFGKVLLVTAGGAVVVTTVADLLARLDGEEPGDPDGPDDRTLFDGKRPGPEEPSATMPTTVPRNRSRRRRVAVAARRVAKVGGVASIVAGGLALTTWWAARTSPRQMWNRRLVRDLGAGPLAVIAATLAWDFVYYWNHRFMHESRYMWAIHVVHHSSEHYNLSTALRQPVADAFGTFLPYSVLCMFGFRPDVVATARALNLLYQYWIHTDTIDGVGPLEPGFNTPSHHRVHHGSQPQYLDRNHGSILIVWDKLFGTFEAEGEKVVYGLTKNIDTYDPLRVATHEHVEMLRDVSRSRTWRERLSNVFRGPGWAVENRRRRNGDGGTSLMRSSAAA